MRRDGGHVLQRFEHGGRADAAVQADHVGAERFEHGRELLGRHAVERVAVVSRGQLRDDRERGRGGAAGAHGGAEFAQVAEGFEHEQVDAAVGERLGLFAEDRLGFVESGLAKRLDADAERSDRAGDVGLVASGRAREPRALLVDGREPRLETERRQLDAVRPERVRLDHVGAGAHVGLMEVGDEVGLREVQLVEAAIEEDALGIEHRPRRTVGDQHALVERFEEWFQRRPATRTSARRSGS